MSGAAPRIGGLWAEDTPVPKDYAPAVVAGSRTQATPVLSAERMILRLQKAMPPYGQAAFGAFYSSAMGGIVTDPALMMLPIDDQLVSRGYGVAECVVLRSGYLYLLEQHMQRLVESCEAADIELPFSKPALIRIVLDTAAASKSMNGMVRFWVTPGRSSFSPLATPTPEASFYALCVADTNDIERTIGWDAVSVQALPSPIGDLMTNNHMMLSMAQRGAASNGAQVSIFTDAEGFVHHCAGYNLCILTKRDTLVFPPHSAVPPSVTLTRLLEMMPEERARSPNDVVISEVQQRPMHVSEVAEAKEAFCVCSTYTIAPLRSVDGAPIGPDGQPGITALALHYMLDNDQLQTNSPRHTAVPYGYTTGMRSQLV